MNTNDIIFSCIDKQPQTRVLYKNTVNGTSFYHVSSASIFWGFVDDMIIQALHWGRNIDEAVSIEVQSQLRIGSSDFGVNPYRIATFYKWLDSEVDSNYVSDRGNMWNYKKTD